MVQGTFFWKGDEGGWTVRGGSSGELSRSRFGRALAQCFRDRETIRGEEDDEVCRDKNNVCAMWMCWIFFLTRHANKHILSHQ